ncbi:MAG: carboxylating nicotinate-nucleotide diphosphorylase [Candidatus Riflebacteria bacterium]|nr:carboxylating nicotinate-nucleotide diphosphorylase [Candidatus Riflebacteria bacterium]
MSNIDSFITEILSEDLGPAGRDISVCSLSESAAKKASGNVLVKTDGIISGLWLIEKVLQQVAGKNSFHINFSARDGEKIHAGTSVAKIEASVGILLTSERTLLNLLQRLSGVATLTNKYVQAVSGTNCKILDTRKTTPGMRALEKAAVRDGGGVNHRFGLYDMIMLKDNHITAMGGNIGLAIQQARKSTGPAVKVEVEVSSFIQFRQALEAMPDMIMLDNMPPDLMKQCVEAGSGKIPKIPLEASGGITLETVRKAAETGVDYISVGAVTHSAPAMDISMKIIL